VPPSRKAVLDQGFGVLGTCMIWANNPAQQKACRPGNSDRIFECATPQPPRCSSAPRALNMALPCTGSPSTTERGQTRIGRSGPRRCLASLSAIPSLREWLEPWRPPQPRRSSRRCGLPSWSTTFPAGTPTMSERQIRLPFDGYGGWISSLPENGKRLFHTQPSRSENFTKPCNRP